jgi:MYXO-CTERM domain-containing protein
MVARCAVMLLAFAAAGPDALAEPAPSAPLTVEGGPGRRITVDAPPSPHAQISDVLFIDRCSGGCRVTKGVNDATASSSTIPSGNGTEYTIDEFVNSAGLTGVAADADWNAVMKCVREVYSPFAVTITDVRPTSGTYHEAILAGRPQNIGQGADILGIAPLAADCSPQNNVISFSFANQHSLSDPNRALTLCWTVAQESAHAFGLDHEYAYKDGRSACNDPMTYRVDCGGQRFFRNEQATCGENAPRPCRCGATQSSHQKLVSVFGEGQAITGNPTVLMTLPAPGGSLGAVVGGTAGSKRGIKKVELRLNGATWNETPGLPFTANGQANPGTYSVVVPASVPDSIIDVQLRAFDDLGAFTDSEIVTVTKGAACTSAATCAKGQKCEQGKCFWDPPAGELGDECPYPQFCKSGMCRGTSDLQICTQSCDPTGPNTCSNDLICIQETGDAGICFVEDSGCCSVGRGRNGPWIHGGIGAAVLGIALRRRRRR